MSDLQLTKLDALADDFQEQLAKLLKRDVAVEQGIESTVRDIIESVQQEGDKALLAYTEQFDRVSAEQVSGLELSEQRLKQALDAISDEQRLALRTAAQRIEAYHQQQLQESWSYEEKDGTVLGQKITPIKRVGIYVPGGKAAYPSSVLMNAVPAKVAGVKEIIMVVPTPDGELNEMVLAAAYIAGVDKVYGIGGAQAVAALAYGTQTIPAVDKIVGPGNVYVATAKKQVFGKVGIDMIAGPSEVLVVADGSVDPDWVAMDLFAQAEHDEMAQSILLSTEQSVLDAVQQSIEKLLPTMERAEIIQASLQANGAFLLVEDQSKLLAVIDEIAPEHLELLIENAAELAEHIHNAGAIFVGKYSAESLGDYCAGPNHVLPTSGTARFSSPLGVYDFQKRTSIIHCSEQGADNIARVASVMARGESLTAHARSAEYRIKAK